MKSLEKVVAGLEARLADLEDQALDALKAGSVALRTTRSSGAYIYAKAIEERWFDGKRVEPDIGDSVTKL